ncbi:hypothetical protein Tco_1130752, partial [Tanacetum coccineum]
QYGGLFGKDRWEYKVSLDYGLSHTQFNLLCTHFVGKPVTISEASIRSDLFFDDADGIDSLNNQAIFDNIQLTGPSLSIAIPDSNPEGSGGNHEGLGQEAKERSQTTYHTSQSLDEECCTKDKIGKEYFWKRISEKMTKNEAKNDKIEHEMERRGKAKSKSKSIKVKVNPDTVNSQRSKPKPKKY